MVKLDDIRNLLEAILELPNLCDKMSAETSFTAIERFCLLEVSAKFNNRHVTKQPILVHH